MTPDFEKHAEPIIDSPWPKVDESALEQDSVVMVFQVNGKVRAKVDVDKNLDKTAIETLALEHEAVKKYLEQGEVRKIIVVPGRLVNIVVN